jgi:hypothetical protein
MDSMNETRDKLDTTHLSNLDYDCGSGYECDCCKTDLTINVDIWYNMDGYIDICETCMVDKKILNNVELIDRRNLTVKEKPLLWNCFECNCKLGGGCKWYLIKSTDVCESCLDKYKSDEPMKGITKITPNNTYVLGNRSDEILIDATSAKYHTFTVPTMIQSEITDKRNQTFIEFIDALVFLNIKGSILKWTLFTDIDYLGYYPAETALIIKCEEPYPVASVCIDDHGRTAFNLIYDTFDDYYAELTSWEKIKLTGDELIKQIEYNKQMMSCNYTVDTENCIRGSKSFSTYIRLKREFDMYYG